MPVISPTMPPTHFSFRGAMAEIELAQADDGIDRQQQAERDRGVARIGPGQRPCVEPDAGGRTNQQRP
jgi:hypothetical protein